MPQPTKASNAPAKPGGRTNYYANQFGKTTANKARRAKRVARRKIAIPQPRKLAPTARAKRRAAATQAHLKAYHAQEAKPVNDNATNAQAATVK